MPSTTVASKAVDLYHISKPIPNRQSIAKFQTAHYAFSATSVGRMALIAGDKPLQVPLFSIVTNAMIMFIALVSKLLLRCSGSISHNCSQCRRLSSSSYTTVHHNSGRQPSWVRVHGTWLLPQLNFLLYLRGHGMASSDKPLQFFFTIENTIHVFRITMQKATPPKLIAMWYHKCCRFTQLWDAAMVHSLSQSGTICPQRHFGGGLGIVCGGGSRVDLDFDSWRTTAHHDIIQHRSTDVFDPGGICNVLWSNCHWLFKDDFKTMLPQQHVYHQLPLTFSPLSNFENRFKPIN